MIFQQILKKVCTGFSTPKNIDLLNSKVNRELTKSNNLISAIIVQTNAKKHLINQHQIYKVVRKKFQDVYIFLIFYT